MSRSKKPADMLAGFFLMTSPRHLDSWAPRMLATTV